MKKFLLLAVAALAFVGCNNAFEDEGNARFEQTTLPTLTAGFEEDTRTYVEDGAYLRWHEGDLISAFVGNTLNIQYRFLGATGANSGEFEPIESDNLGTGSTLDRIYAVYPYNVSSTISNNGIVNFALPAEQGYAENSFGRGANTMIAVTESDDDRYLGFKNTCGYLKIKLHGGGVVTSIKLKGNNGEKIAGNATIAATYGGVPDIDMLDDATDSIILDCGDGVELSTDAENPTEFWIVVPPIEFSKGITIVAYSDKTDYEFTKSTDSPITIERNVVQPMKSLRAEFLGHTGNDHNPSQIPNDEIWYTSTDGNIVEPYITDVFGANIVSNAYDDGKGVIKFDGDVTTIGKQAFLDCTRLESIIIPNKVTTIGGSAFSGCTNLISVIIGNSVTTIGEWAFIRCKSLTSITIPDSVTTIGDGAFYECYSLTNITIGDCVTTIGDYAFCDCDSLTNITIGDSVTTIGDYAFSDCENITNVFADLVTWCNINFYNIASNPLYCEANLYLNNKIITDLIFPSGITEIKRYAFLNCYSLISVTIPDSITRIGEYAFCNCKNLTNVYCKATTPPVLEGDPFSDCDNLRNIYVPISVIDFYISSKYDWYYCHADHIVGYSY